MLLRKILKIEFLKSPEMPEQILQKFLSPFCKFSKQKRIFSDKMCLRLEVLLQMQKH